jgi:hypothetical protein
MNSMEYDIAKLDEIILALLHLNAFSDHGVSRAWKGFDWDSLDRLHARGLIADPKSKAKSGGAHRRGSSFGRGVVQEALWQGRITGRCSRRAQRARYEGRARRPPRLSVLAVRAQPRWSRFGVRAS